MFVSRLQLAQGIWQPRRRQAPVTGVESVRFGRLTAANGLGTYANDHEVVDDKIVNHKRVVMREKAERVAAAFHSAANEDESFECSCMSPANQ
jgi:hypothetical protein